MKSEQNSKVYDFRFDIFFACYFVSMALFVKKNSVLLFVQLLVISSFYGIFNFSLLCLQTTLTRKGYQLY